MTASYYNYDITWEDCLHTVGGFCAAVLLALAGAPASFYESVNGSSASWGADYEAWQISR